MKIILAEKPSVAGDIAKVLGVKKREDGYINVEGGYLVTWAIGHLVGLAKPDEYEVWSGKWDINLLPMIPSDFKLSISSDAGIKKQYKVIEKLLKDASELIIATDAGREGELIARWIIDKAGYKGPTKRLWISSLTDKAIQDGFNNLKDGRSFDNLAAAARERAYADWMLGMNASRVYSLKANVSGLSVGRVMTPTLAMIVEREKLIRNFSSKDFWEVTCVFEKDGQKFMTKYKNEDESRFFDKSLAEKLLAEVENREGVIFSLEKKEVRKRQPLFFDLTALQKVMNDKHSWTAQKTLDIAQKLYEAKHLTYPRTDSRFLTKELARELKERINPSGRDISSDKRYTDESKITDHHAIIPTGNKYGGNNSDENLLLELVENYTRAVFEKDGIDEETHIEIKIDEHIFEAKGLVVLEAGWRNILQVESKEKNLPILVEDEKICQIKTELATGKTEPPKRFTESSLLSAMENAGKDLEKGDKEMLKSVGGIGTPATRSAILETMKHKEYVILRSKDLYASEKGMSLIDALGQSPLVSPQITASWEELLKMVEEGRLAAEDFRKEIVSFTEKVVENAKSKDVEIIKDEAVSLGSCPICKKEVKEYRKAYSCSYKSCDFVIWKVIAGKNISLVQAKKLIEKGESDLIKGFNSKNGNKFNARLYLREDKSIGYKFE